MTRGQEADPLLLRAECLRYLETVKALAMVSFGVIMPQRSGAETEAAIESADVRSLRRYKKKMEQNITTLRSILGATEPDESYAVIRREALAEGWDYVILPKWHIDELFPKLPRYAPAWNRLPLQTWAHVHLEPREPTPTRVMWLEENAHSDMAALWNQSLASYGPARAEMQESGPFGPRSREHAALVRLTIQAAYHFVEAFLNGAAFNFWYANKERLDPGVCTMLLEWDEVRARRAHLSLREKLLKYPRIISGAPIPLFTDHDDNFQFMTSTVMRIRHTHSHLSPRPDGAAGSVVDLAPFFESTDMDVAGRAVDAAVSLAKRIAESCYRERGWLYWLRERSTDTRTFQWDNKPRTLAEL